LRTRDEKQARHTATCVLATSQADWEIERLRLRSDPAEAEQLTDLAIFEMVAEFYHFEKAADETGAQQMNSSSALLILHPSRRPRPPLRLPRRRPLRRCLSAMPAKIRET
jgi:hypothetical protein